MTLSSQASLDDWEEAREECSAIMEHEGGASREQADTWSQEWLVECLARELLQWSLSERRAFLDRWEARHGAESAGTLKAALKAEWERQRNG